MEDMHSYSSSVTGVEFNALVLDHSLTLLTEAQIKHLHNVDSHLWDLSFQPTVAVQTGQSSMAVPLSHSNSPSQPITSPQSWIQQATGITESPNERTNLYGHGFASAPDGDAPVSSPLRPTGKVISKGRDNKSRLAEESYAPSAARILATVLLT
ncbi:hypothetical protein FPRO05_10077 [Fusarium proliferatum]|uniref:Uncharacterized protein n=1 Tax=Gibberella intermedia TaxID=948311 RepID=A0A365NF38_GIBIN|nr:hypothetical protein FPRO05_10077 [Fusarium proliferatum]